MTASALVPHGMNEFYAVALNIQNFMNEFYTIALEKEYFMMDMVLIITS